jgi:DNA repair and recombination protein RAD52
VRNACVSQAISPSFQAHQSSPGDQHKGAATFNPFEEPQQHISEYTAQEVATLQSKLERQLGPEWLTTRPGAGGSKVHYVTAEKVITLANDVFGFNGWSSSIRHLEVDFVSIIVWWYWLWTCAHNYTDR